MERIEIENYPVYKDSGVEWLGEIPASWDFKKMKFIFKDVSEKNMPDAELLSVTQDQGVVPRTWVENRMVMPSGNLHSFKFINKGDFAISLRSFEGGVEYCHHDGIISPAYTVLKAVMKLHDGYYKYLFKSQAFISELQTSIVGIREGKNISYEELCYSYLPIPSQNEQIAIANFLDRKTAQIDKAIAQKEKLIELLKEHRQIMIHKAVTRGLNPNVKLKDSCVEWISEIPEHWEVKRLKYVVQILKRIIGHEGPDVLSITQKGIKIKDIESGEGQLAMDYSKYQMVFKGEFAMNHMDLLTGYVDISQFDGVISPDYRVFVPIDPSIVDQYLLKVFQICYKNKIFYRYGQGVSLLGRWRFPTENFNDFFIPIPPFSEQGRIVQHCNLTSNKVDIVIGRSEKEIEKLKEYKSSLVNAAVTGKIKV